MDKIGKRGIRNFSHGFEIEAETSLHADIKLSYWANRYIDLLSIAAIGNDRATAIEIRENISI